MKNGLEQGLQRYQCCKEVQSPKIYVAKKYTLKNICFSEHI